MAKWNAKNCDLSFGREHTAKSWQLSVTTHQLCGAQWSSVARTLRSGCIGNKRLAPHVGPPSRRSQEPAKTLAIPGKLATEVSERGSSNHSVIIPASKLDGLCLTCYNEARSGGSFSKFLRPPLSKGLTAGVIG